MKKAIIIIFIVVGLTSKSKGQHTVGEKFDGGIVFYVDKSGQHGLIADTLDLGDQIWSPTPLKTTNVLKNDGIYAGKKNTDDIIDKHGIGIYAAVLCARHAGGGFTDWYLPSKYELNLLYSKRGIIGGFTKGTYWSSSEFTALMVWEQNFGTGKQAYADKIDNYLIRPIRKF